jgi:hypothetical protein
VKPELDRPVSEKLAGTAERVTFHNEDNGLFVLQAKARGYRDLVTIVGHAPTISASEWITATGEWVNDRTQQFEARKSALADACGNLQAEWKRRIGAVIRERPVLRHVPERIQYTNDVDPSEVLRIALAPNLFRDRASESVH